MPLTPRQEATARSVWLHTKKLSPSRFAQYEFPADQSFLDPLSRYLWNVSLCEALHPMIHGAEILLKNQIHAAVSQHTGNPWWFQAPGFLLPKQDVKLQNALADLSQKGKPSPSADDVVAELSFGFWTSLLSSPYDQSVALPYLRTASSHWPGHFKKRSEMALRFNNIRHLRNRTSHHEPVWRMPNLLQIHEDSIEIMRWMDPVFAKYVRLTDRFPDVYKSGLAAIKNQFVAMVSPA